MYCKEYPGCFPVYSVQDIEEPRRDEEEKECLKANVRAETSNEKENKQSETRQKKVRY